MPLSAQIERLELDHGWHFRQSTATTEHVGTEASRLAVQQWRPAVVPGDVHLDLLREKLIPDPFFGTNEAKLQWISDAAWEYQTEVNLPANLAAHRHLDLVFEGLDTYAEVYLNDKLVLTADNQFRTWRLDAKPYLTAGKNTLRIVFPPQDAAAEQMAQRDPWYPRNSVLARSYLRKAAYEHGWDWGPTFVTAGVWKPVRLEGWDTARIADFHVRQNDVSASAAHLSAEVDIEAGEASEATLDLASTTPAGASGPHSSLRTSLHPGRNSFTVPLELLQPQRWFPAGYGAQPLYRFTATLRTGKATDLRSVRTGLRSVELRRERDQWGRSFEFVVNGIPVYAKGADVIPSDSFANRVTPVKYRAMLESAVQANMNMVRLWGGGYYEMDEFYDLCDELGIMVWHDFMFGNEWQPGTYDFKQSVAHEAEDQLRRLRNHPSIVLWCGNNETEIAFHWENRDKLDPAVRIQMWQDYLSLFHGVLATAAARFTPETPYWPSSPSADLEATTPGFQAGDEHIWDVWHGRVPFSTYEQHHARFVTEYGFQSFPEMRTIETFTTPPDRTSIFTPVMLAHQKNKEGNDLIRTYLLRDYPEPKDFASFLYVSQVLQAEGIKIGAEHLRRERGRNMGGIYWQLNDCWPVASWSSIDSLGRWKALQFYAKRFYAPILVSPHVENGRVAIYGVSDRTEMRQGELVVRHLGLDGTVLSSITQTVTLPPLSSTMLLSLSMEKLSSESGTHLETGFIAATLTVKGEQTSHNLAYLVPVSEMHLPPAAVQYEVTKASSGSGVDVILRSPVLARSVLLTSTEVTAQFKANFVDLLPSEPQVVHVDTQLSPDELRRTLTVHSLADAFAPGTATAATAAPESHTIAD